MSQFTDAQLAELEAVFDLKRQDSLPVRDGRVTKDSMVWWRGADGPQRVKAGSERHWPNIGVFPNVYQIAEPRYRLEYLD